MGFPVNGKVWMNGSMVDWADARIHIASHVIHYGSGVFEGIRCYDTPKGSAVFRLDDHMRRLHDSARIYRMEYRFGQGETTAAVLDTIRANDLKACYIRPIIYRGYEALGVNPLPCPVDGAILVWEWGAYFGKEAAERGADIKVSSWNRPAPNTFPAMAKSVANYANAQLIKMEAVLEGYTEAVALDVDGTIGEGSGQNIFVVRNQVLYTSPNAGAILPGITRDSVITLARELGYRVREERIPREMLYIADEAFFVGTAVEITAVRSVDKIVVGEGKRGPITAQLHQAFFDIVNGVTPDRHGWLTYVDQNDAGHRAAAASASAASR
jgi:branched-chain amino acid aminotransferase